MVVLKRRQEQSIRIGPDVVVTVVAIQRGAVTLAISAPPSLRITREPHEPNGCREVEPSLVSTQRR